jgi:thiol-disulfide isomerase/thioredoxin
VNIAPLATYNFTHGTTLTVAAGTNYNVDVTVTAVSDAVSANNILSTVIYGLTFLPTTRVVGEEGTGTWCGWCPRGAVFMEQMANDYPSTWVGIAVHNADPMTVTAYDAGVSALISGYPSGLIDRIPETDPSDFPTVYASRVAVTRPAGVAVSNGWNPSTRVMSVTVDATFAASLTGVSMRLAAVIVEDDVTGTTSSYNQTNYYSSTSQNIPLSGAGHNWQTEPNPVLAANMTYDHVARALLPSFAGQLSSIPTSVTAGNTYSYTFNYTVPATQDETQMKVIGLLINSATDEIVNAAEGQAVLGIDEEANNLFSASLYPNPANDLVTLNLNIKEMNEVTIDMYNIAGLLVNSSNLGSLNGENRITLNASSYEAGIYTVHINVGGSVMTQKMIIVH